jgi:hypothetical protein
VKCWKRKNRKNNQIPFSLPVCLSLSSLSPSLSFFLSLFVCLFVSVCLSVPNYFFLSFSGEIQILCLIANSAGFLSGFLLFFCFFRSFSVFFFFFSLVSPRENQ